MELKTLLSVLEPVEVVVPAGFDREVTGIAYDSRQVQPGDMFFCIQGFTTDGHLYVSEAVSRGAAAIVHSKPLDPAVSAAMIRVNDTRRAMGLCSALFFNYPSRRLKVVGVTGTKGKTTTTYLVKSVLEAADFSVGLIGTNQNLIGSKVIKAQRTTPESLELQRLLAEMVRVGCTHVVMEVSSHAVELGRTVGTYFDAGVFTNITRDHLDFHKTFEHYLAAKTRFFSHLSEGPKQAFAVINGDDPNSAHIIQKTRVPVLTYGLGQNWDVRAEDVRVSPQGVSYVLRTKQGDRPLKLQLTGRFNVYNSLAAAAVGIGLGVSLSDIGRGLENVTGVAGRFESVDLGQDYTVIVDYAHTPDSLQNVLQTARALTKGRVIVAFGCGGDRDKGKRPLMGKIAGELADYVIITSDNPRSEDPASICREIEVGLKQLPNHAPYEVLVDRREGIFRAIALARPGDLVLIAGKGHETYQIFADKTIHFDDREVAVSAIQAARSGS